MCFVANCLLLYPRGGSINFCRAGDSGLWCPSTGARSIFAFIRNSACEWEIRTEDYHRVPVASVAYFILSLDAIVNSCIAADPSGCCQPFEEGV